MWGRFTIYINMFAILVETSSSMTSSRILGELSNPNFHFFKFFNALSCIFLYVEARRVARIWKRGGGGGGGGYFERVRSVQTTLTGMFIDVEAVSDGFAEN